MSDTLAVSRIAAAGMVNEEMRFTAAATNIANANVPSSRPDGVPPMLAYYSSPISFVDYMAVQDSTQRPGGGLTAVLVEPRVEHDPKNPSADGDGNVFYLNVDHVQEMIAARGAMRAYEANLTIFSTSKTMINRLLEIGG